MYVYKTASQQSNQGAEQMSRWIQGVRPMLNKKDILHTQVQTQQSRRRLEEKTNMQVKVESARTHWISLIKGEREKAMAHACSTMMDEENHQSNSMNDEYIPGLPQDLPVLPKFPDKPALHQNKLLSVELKGERIAAVSCESPPPPRKT